MSEPTELAKDAAFWLRDNLAPPLLWTAAVVGAAMTVWAGAKKFWRFVNASVERLELLREMRDLYREMRDEQRATREENAALRKEVHDIKRVLQIGGPRKEDA